MHRQTTHISEEMRVAVRDKKGRKGKVGNSECLVSPSLEKRRREGLLGRARDRSEWDMLHTPVGLVCVALNCNRKEKQREA